MELSLSVCLFLSLSVADAGVFLEQSCGQAAKALWCSPGGHTSEGITESKAAGSGHLCALRLLTFSLITFRSPFAYIQKVMLQSSATNLSC